MKKLWQKFDALVLSNDAFLKVILGLFALSVLIIFVYVSRNLEDARELVKPWIGFTAYSLLIGTFSLWIIASISEKLNLEKILDPIFAFLIVVGIINWLLCLLFMVIVGLISVIVNLFGF